MTAETRKAALEKLAEHHEVSPGENTTAGEDLRDYLAEPKTIKRWVAVTFAAEHVHYLKAAFESAAEAQGYAGGLMEDMTFPELPVEVFDLDTGERIEARLAATWEKA